MEFAVVKDPRNFGAANLLGVPGMGFSLLDSDDEKCVVVMGIVPRSSPLPRRKTSEEELEEAQQQQPAHGSRRVCFADAKGLCLVLVKEFDCWDVPKLLGYDQMLAEGQDVERYSYYLSFPSPLPTPPEELGSRVREQRIELESIELLPGTTVLRGLVRVLNVSFDKTVFVRTTLDAWASHFDLLAEYVQGSSDGSDGLFFIQADPGPPVRRAGIQGGLLFAIRDFSGNLLGQQQCKKLRAVLPPESERRGGDAAGRVCMQEKLSEGCQVSTLVWLKL
ncbi:Protein phosphatase 1 regulatory subunit 3A [Merluccius polli]|uniref:Protein phosphatase 1 regulatory subunit 3A n=1 Tax=Merluccius polli TaxID=89951 RepID=A0AA47MXY9_MERPO|nr:Protein phosphatase 1 regulatory subunit 3A [Merluccius polli]